MDARMTQVLLGIIALALIALVVLLAVDVVGREPAPDPEPPTIRTVTEFVDADGILEALRHDLATVQDLLRQGLDTQANQWNAITEVEVELQRVWQRLDRIDGRLQLELSP